MKNSGSRIDRIWPGLEARKKWYLSERGFFSRLQVVPLTPQGTSSGAPRLIIFVINARQAARRCPEQRQLSGLL